MTREEAIKLVKRIKGAMVYTEEEKEALETLIPELAESEDERIRAVILKLMLGMRDEIFTAQDELVTKPKVLAWLEKQKENPKSADSIPSDCTSDAKCKDRWHKVSDSLPDNPREVLCKDEAGNYFIGRYYVGEGWEISNYDDEDKPHYLNPPVSKWIDFPSEKQKEQKPVEIHIDNPNIQKFDPDVKVTTSDSSADGKELLYVSNKSYNIGFRDGVASVKPAEWSDNDDQLIGFIFDLLNDLVWQKNWAMSKEECLERLNSLRPVKQEWSEEDEEMLEEIINHIYTTSVQRIPARPGSDIGKSWIKFLKSLPPSWKPSEEQIYSLGTVVKGYDECTVGSVGYHLKEMYEQLKKLI